MLWHFPISGGKGEGRLICMVNFAAKESKNWFNLVNVWLVLMRGIVSKVNYRIAYEGLQMCSALLASEAKPNKW